MFCKNCGTEIKTGERYCYRCGAVQAAGGTKENGSGTKKIRWAIFVVGLLLLAVGAVILIFALKGKGAGSSELKEKLSLAERYLDELDYERAVAAYKAAIGIDPKCEEAYTGLAEAAEKLADEYLAEGKTEEAEDLLEEVGEILEDGYEETRAEDIEAKSERILKKRRAAAAKKEEDADKDTDEAGENGGEADAAPAGEADPGMVPALEEGVAALIEFEWDISGVTVFENVYDPDGMRPEADQCDLTIYMSMGPGLTRTRSGDGTGAEYRDGNGKLILEEKTERRGNKKHYSCKAYSLAYDFDITAEPVTLVYGLPSYPVEAWITYQDGRKIRIENMEARSYTGAQYFGICTNSNGQLGAYQPAVITEYGAY